MTTHRHKDSRGLWTTTVTDPSLALYAKSTDLAALAARVTALEAAPPPPPPPTTRPFPAPVTTQTVAVPTSIDATGATDVGPALRAFIAGVPDGSIVNFAANGIYKVGDLAIRFTNKHDLILEGNGATIQQAGVADNSNGSAFALWNGNTDIVIRNFTIVGQNSQSGYHAATNENRYGVLVYGGTRTEIANVTMLNIWADFVTIAGTLSGADEVEGDNVWIHDCTLTHSGRMGISATCATHVLIERNTFDLTTWCTLDVEPNTLDQEVGWITFRDNIIKRGGPNTPGFVSARGGVNTPNVHDITITGNRTDQTLETDIDHVSRRRNVVFTNNVALKPAAGPVLRFAHVDGLTYHGNGQPLTSGTLASVSDCTNVVTTP